MKDLSIGRAALGLAIATLVAFLAGFTQAWGNPPLSTTAVYGEINAHALRCVVAGLNHAMAAIPAWLTGWAIKSTNGGRALVWMRERFEDPGPRNFSTEPMPDATTDRARELEEIQARLDALRRTK